MSEVLDKALALHQAGQLAPAAQLYQQILASQPDEADALHLLGVLHHQQGQNARAVELIGRAIAVRPNAPTFHASLASACIALGQNERAVESCRAALALQPDYFEALNNLGLALSGLGRREEAIEQFQAALRLRPDFAVTHHNLGLALHALRRFDEALRAYRRAVELAPAYPSAQADLGRLLVDMNRSHEAMPYCREAVRRQPRMMPWRLTLAAALRAMDRLDEAAAAYVEAIKLDPGFAPAYAGLGFLLEQQGRHREALPVLKKAAELDPRNLAFWTALAMCHQRLAQTAEAVPCWQHILTLNPQQMEVRLFLAGALQAEGRLDEAKEHYRAVLQVRPDATPALVFLGQVHEEQGDLSEAESSYRAALRVDPTCAPAHGNLAKLLRGKLPEADRAALEKRLADPQLHPLVQAHLLFGLTAVLDGQGDFARAAETSRRGNALTLQGVRSQGHYDPARHVEFVDAVVKAFDRDFFARVSGWGLDTRRPVFVFGLPRSGTTLVEQVLASHPRVHGAGELSLGDQTFKAIPAALGRSEPPIDCVPHLTETALRTLAGSYLEQLGKVEGHAERIVDKRPENYLFLGLLAALFPQATFIHCRRDLRDTALSCWLTHFTTIPWTHDPGHIATHFQQYLRLMAHWRKVLPAPIHEVVYEDMVSDLDGNARRLIAACGLEWDPACLEFHRTQRAVRSPGGARVRQPVSTQSVGRWKNYQTHLADLFAALPREEAPA
jgi:tetratricopeptide (TPR) repeat protein